MFSQCVFEKHLQLGAAGSASSFDQSLPGFFVIDVEDDRGLELFHRLSKSLGGDEHFAFVPMVV